MDNCLKSSKLPIKVKLAYGIGEIGKNLIIYLTNYYLLYFYTDVIKIPAAAAAVILLISRIWSAINDPVMGVICDKTKSKHGKCRFYFRNFSIPAGICIFLSFYVPELSSFMKIIWVSAMYMISCTLNTTLNIPMNTFIPRLTDDKYERVSLTQYKSFMILLPSTLIPAITLPMVKLFGSGNMRLGFAVGAAIYGAIFTICHLVCYFLTKGYEKIDDETTDDNQELNNEETLKVKDMLIALIKNKYCLLSTIGFILFLVFACIQGSTLVYYLQYNMKNTDLMAVFSLISNFAGILPIFFLKLLVKKFGNAKTCFLSCFVIVIGEAIRLITHDGYTSVLFIGWGLEGLGLNLFSSLLAQCMFDSMVYGEWKTGVKIEALTMSVLSLGQKIGIAVGGVASAFLLTTVNYNPDAAVQPAKVLTLFFTENVTLPLTLFLILAFVFMYIAKLEKKLPQMQKEIDSRKKL